VFPHLIAALSDLAAEDAGVHQRCRPAHRLGRAVPRDEWQALAQASEAKATFKKR
jgi:hypothetical protein